MYATALTNTTLSAAITARQTTFNVASATGISAGSFLAIVNALLPFLPPLMKLVSALLPPLLSIIQALIPIIVQGVQAIAQLVPVFVPLINIISAILIPVINVPETREKSTPFTK